MLKLILLVILGATVGSVITTIVSRVNTAGKLLIDTSDTEDGPHMFLQLHKNPNVVMKKKHVSLKVVITNLLSQE